MRDYCPHCWPTKTTSHFANHIDYYSEKLLKPLIPTATNANLWGPLLEILAKFRLVEFVDSPDRSQLYNRSLIFFEEAKKRGLNIQAVKAFGRYDNSFRAVVGNRKIYYEGTPLNIIGRKSKVDPDDKITVKKLLQSFGLPVCDGGAFTSAKKAIRFVETLGFPVIVKPVYGSLSHHVSGRVDDLKALKIAIKIVQQYQPKFIIERFITGNLYRATVFNKKSVFVCKKEPANIIGDGKSTIEELIRTKNKGRGSLIQLDITIHEIPIDEGFIRRLKRRKLILKSVLPKDEKLYLQDKVVLGAGCDIQTVSKVHKDNILLFKKVAEVLNTGLVGIDFIAKDVAQSYKKQSCAIIETNSLPYIDMHQNPTSGQSEPVAKLVWDSLLKRSSHPE